MAPKALITGASSGLGEALARAYLNRGWQVYGVSRSVPGELMKMADFSHQQLDLANLDTIAEGLRQLIHGKSLDLVVLNAGVLGEFNDLARVPMADVRKTMDINLWANKAIIDCLVADKIQVQQVVAISSGASISGARGWSGYGISKAALNMLVKLYSAELPETHFCALAPGLIDSAMQDYLCSITADDDYPILQRLKGNRGTEAMPAPSVAADLVMEAIDKVRIQVQSGEYVDVRNLD